MKRRLALIVLFLFTTVITYLLLTALAHACGVERWSVKTLSDPQANQVVLIPLKTDIPTLVNTPAPILPRNNSIRLPEERQVYKLRGTMLLEFKLESDQDIHLVLENTRTLQTMIAEIPSPDCVASLFAQNLIAKVRSDFTRSIGLPSDRFQTVNVRVTLTGVRFFDFFHHQTGVAANAVELHPVLSFRLGT